MLMLYKKYILYYSSHGIIVDGTIWSTAKNIIECRAFESFTLTELNDRFARLGKVDVMEIGSTLG